MYNAKKNNCLQTCGTKVPFSQIKKIVTCCSSKDMEAKRLDLLKK
jgi:hypothetical protein